MVKTRVLKTSATTWRMTRYSTVQYSTVQYLEDGCVDGGTARHQDPRVLAQPEAEPLGVHPLGGHLTLHQGPHLVDAIIFNIFYHIYNTIYPASCMICQEIFVIFFVDLVDDTINNLAKSDNN